MKLRKNLTQDRARRLTDKRLADTEKKISRMYKTHSALIQARKEYDAYMKQVEKRTEASYLAFRDEKDIEHKAELKKAYGDEIRVLTIESKEYNRIIEKLVNAITQVNQEAVRYINSQMAQVYMENYNQVAVECERVGIKVNGKEQG